MADVVWSTWDEAENTQSWVHDGSVEQSAADIVTLASAASGYADSASSAASAAATAESNASAFADGITGYVASASAYADTASAYADSAGADIATISGYMTSAGGYATTASGYADTASGYMASAGGYVTTVSGYAITASGYMTSAGGYVASASGYAGTASGYANTASGYASTAGGYVTTASGYMDTTSGYMVSAAATLSNCVTLTGNQTVSGTKTFASTISGTITSATSAGSATSATSAGYATSAGTATSASSAGVASKIGTATVGTSTKPVYISAGVPVSMAVVASASSAGYATSAGTATSATSAGYATSADAATSATVAAAYLPLSGGTMTGYITRSGDIIKSGVTSGQVSIYNGTQAADGGGIWLYGKGHANKGMVRLQGYYDSTYGYRSFSILPSVARCQTNCSIIPTDTNSVTLGLSTNRWSEIWQTNGSVTGSDERIKSSIQTIPDAVLDAWEDVNWSQFQMNDAVAKKGADNARLHTGLIAQRIDEAFKAHGLDASRYGLFCYDEWNATAEEIGDEGNIIVPAREAGDAYSLRYDECLCMEAAYQRRRADRMQAELDDIKARLSALEG